VLDTSSYEASISQQESEAHLTENPVRLSLNMTSMSLPDRRFAFAAGALCFIGYIYWANWGLVLAASVSFILFWRRNWGRNYFLAFHGLLSLWIRAKGGVIYSVKKGRGLLNPSLLFPFELTEFRNTDIGNVCLLFNKKTRTDSAYIVADGSWFSSRDLGAQNQFLARLADDIKKVFAIGGRNVGVSFVGQLRPVNLEHLLHAYGQNLHPAVVNAPTSDRLESRRSGRKYKPIEEMSDEERRLAFLADVNLKQLPAEVGVHGREFTMALVLSVQRSKKKNVSEITKGKRETVSQQELENWAIIEAVDSVIGELRHIGVDNPRALDLRGMQDFLRSTWDLLEINEYNEWSAQADDEERFTSSRHWPDKQIRVSRGFMIIDESPDDNFGNFHATFMVTGLLPKSLPDWFSHLYPPNVSNISVASIGMPVTYQGEYYAIDKALQIKQPLFDLFGRSHEGPRVQSKTQEMQKRQWDLFNSRFGDKRAIYVSISDDTREGLEKAAKKVRQYYDHHEIKVKRLPSESRQLAGLLASAGIDVL